jgi:hypothetical protein
MESARADRERAERIRVALGVSATVLISATPSPFLHDLARIGAYFGWFLHLLDIHLTAISEHQSASYLTGWTLLATAVVSSLLRTEHSFWWSVPLWIAMFWLLWRAWKDTKEKTQETGREP